MATRMANHAQTIPKNCIFCKAIKKVLVFENVLRLASRQAMEGSLLTVSALFLLFESRIESSVWALYVGPLTLPMNDHVGEM